MLFRYCAVLATVVGVVGACTFEQNTDYKGNDILPLTKLQVANASECCARCAAHTKCTVWTLQPGIGCYLKTSDAGRRAYAGATSGSLSGPAPPPVPPPAPTCRTRTDCSLGGECVHGACACDPTWSGPHCAQLNLAPAPAAPLCDNGGDQSWGGNAVFDASDRKISVGLQCIARGTAGLKAERAPGWCGQVALED